MLTDFEFTSVFKRAGASSLDFWDLLIEVGKLLPSIFEKPTVNSNNKALNLMELVIYHIAPSTRQIKAGQDSDKHWNMRSYHLYTKIQLDAMLIDAVELFNQSVPEDKRITNANKGEHVYSLKFAALLNYWELNYIEAELKYHISGTITCATFKSVAAPLDAPKVSVNRGITLTMKQVSLVAIHILNTYTPIAVEAGFIVLTPLGWTTSDAHSQSTWKHSVHSWKVS